MTIYYNIFMKEMEGEQKIGRERNFTGGHSKTAKVLQVLGRIA